MRNGRSQRGQVGATFQGPKGWATYYRFYIDYGATAHLDVRFRRFEKRTIVFVFMYVQNEDKIIDTILQSLRSPSHSGSPDGQPTGHD